MPRKKRKSRKGERRKVVDRRDNAYAKMLSQKVIGKIRAEVFWTKVFNGFEKFLESPFKKEKSKKSKKRVLHG